MELDSNIYKWGSDSFVKWPFFETVSSAKKPMFIYSSSPQYRYMFTYSGRLNVILMMDRNL